MRLPRREGGVSSNGYCWRIRWDRPEPGIPPIAEAHPAQSPAARPLAGIRQQYRLLSEGRWAARPRSYPSVRAFDDLEVAERAPDDHPEVRVGRSEGAGHYEPRDVARLADAAVL